MPRPRRTVNIKKERESKMEGFEELEQETESRSRTKRATKIKKEQEAPIEESEDLLYIEYLTEILKAKKAQKTLIMRALDMEILMIDKVVLDEIFSKPNLDYVLTEATNTVKKKKQSVRSASATRTKSKPIGSIPKRTRSANREAADKYKTPTSIKPSHFATVTPKIAPNMPSVILRKPKYGEHAISLAGSPLLVQTTSNESEVSAHLPLRDGNVYAIMAERGLRVSQVPNFDEDTQRKLLLLNQNLQKICSAFK